MKFTINHGLKFLIKNLRAIFLGLFILLLQGCGQMPTADLQNLTLPTTSNYYLICPKGFCNVQPNEYSPVYNVSAADLFNAWNQVLTKQIYITITGTIPEKAQYEYVQKSIVFGFPDYITVQFIALSDYSSSLAIYSRSQYGFYDFGVNKKRVQKLLAQLNQVVTNLPPSNQSTAAANSDEEDQTNVKNLNNLVVPNTTATGNTNASSTTSTDNSGATSSVDTNMSNSSATGTDNTSGTTTGSTSANATSSSSTTGDASTGNTGAASSATSTDNANVTTSGGTATDNSGVNTSN